VSEEDRRDIGWAVAKARKRYTGPDPEIFNFVQAALTTDLLEQSPVYDRADVLRFAMRFQQYTGPVTAKAVEDTAFYRYTRLLSLNEVGGDPARFGTSPQAFHHAMQLRTKHWPHALNAGATHDTKRGEDARARLNVLSELGAEWETRVERWGALNRFRRYDLEDLTAPSPADEYMIYQMLVGSWPPDDPISEDTLAQFRCRAGEAVRKALREAKRITSWYNPNEAYESACLDFVDKILDIEKTNPFLDDFREFVAQIAPLGVLNSLSQIVLKHTVPGIPDAYQGTELWDHSFVDPDNRRPVDYAERTRRLAAAETFADDPHAYAQALAQWQDGTIKLAIQAALLKLRAEIPALFRDGSYEPLELRGARSVNALAFLRGRGQDRCVVVAGRLFASLAENAVPYSGLTAWGDTALILPQVERLRNIFTGEEIQVENEAAPVGLLLATLPAGVFRILP
jgi:(1->4)-alpha-D-glucan 1-alpha-D-glucosylmutase